MTFAPLEPQDEHDQALVRHVHPPGWQNPRVDGRYNLVVLGAGTAGLVTAAGAAGLGAKVALVERHLMGGDCLNVGCVPSKAVLASARAAHAVRTAARFGIKTAGDVEVDFAAAMTRMRALRARIAPHDSAARFSNLGIDVFFGHGRFMSPTSLQVEGQRLDFAKAVIATGGRPALPAIEGLAEAGVLTNETVFSLTVQPRRLAVIGAGPIGCELAQAFARFGTFVTLLGKQERVLPKDEPQASAVVAESLLRDGVDVRLGVDVRSVRGASEGTTVYFVNPEGLGQHVQVDAVLVATGRSPNVDDMGLEAARVRFDTKKGVIVDDRLRTSNRHIFAAGDVAGHFQFTHAADAMARAVIKNALFFGRDKLSALVIPWVTYTDPEVARVGLSEAEAHRKGKGVKTHHVPLASVDRSVLEGDTEGFARVHTDARGYILGATIVAQHAGEMVAPLVLAMTHAQKLSALGATVFPYPTETEVLKRVADAANRARLTPGIKAFFGWFLRRRR